MPPDRHDAEIGLLLSAFVVFIAAILAYRQWQDRRHRDSELERGESAYYAWQDVRRWLGVLVMIVLASLALGFAWQQAAAIVRGLASTLRGPSAWPGEGDRFPHHI